MRDIQKSQTLRRLTKNKSIGFATVVAVLFNSAIGPAVPFTPDAFKRTGYMFAIACHVFFFIISSLSSLFLVEAMQSIPGNNHFQADVEYAAMISFYSSHWLHILGQIIVYCAHQSIAILSTILSAHLIDKMYLDFLKSTCGFSLTRGLLICLTSDQVHNMKVTENIFGDENMLFTFGFLTVFSLYLLLSNFKFRSQVRLQLAMAIFVMFIFIQWNSAVAFGPEGIDIHRITGQVKAKEQQTIFGTIMGVVMVSFAIPTIMPSVVNIKQKEVSVQKAVWLSMFLVLVFYKVTGMILSSGFEVIEENIFNTLLEAHVPSWAPVITRITIYLFAFFMLIPAIPLLNVVAKENLVQTEFLAEPFANFLAYVLPWIGATILQSYDDHSILRFQLWTGLVFVSPANFLIPMLIFLASIRFRHQYNIDKKLTNHQLELLKEFHSHSDSMVKHISGLQLENNESLMGNQELNAPQPSYLDENVPDADEEDQYDIQHGIRRPNIFNFFQTTPRSVDMELSNQIPVTVVSNEQSTDRNLQREPLRRGFTGVLNPEFKSAAFRSIPRWIGVKAEVIAWIVLVLTTLITIGSTAIAFYDLFFHKVDIDGPATNKDPTGHFNGFIAMNPNSQPAYFHGNIY
ncbi:hypothetical protein BC833DRAFT_571864 [Globomyces pollinis-pini]|nr:hypothetical protein BC833DRAFT_571864 [Globomyces pollinis-pini]